MASTTNKPAEAHVLTRPRYVVLSVALLAVAVGMALTGALAGEHGAAWLEKLAIPGTGLPLGFGLVMAARAVLPDRWRAHAFPQGRIPQRQDQPLPTGQGPDVGPTSVPASEATPT